MTNFGINDETINYLNKLKEKSKRKFKREYSDELLQVCYEAGYFRIMNEQFFSSPDRFTAWNKGRLGDE